MTVANKAEEASVVSEERALVDDEVVEPTPPITPVLTTAATNHRDTFAKGTEPLICWQAHVRTASVASVVPQPSRHDAR